MRRSSRGTRACPPERRHAASSYGSSEHPSGRIKASGPRQSAQPLGQAFRTAHGSVGQAFRADQGTLAQAAFAIAGSVGQAFCAGNGSFGEAACAV